MSLSAMIRSVSTGNTSPSTATYATKYEEVCTKIALLTSEQKPQEINGVNCDRKFLAEAIFYLNPTISVSVNGANILISRPAETKTESRSKFPEKIATDICLFEINKTVKKSEEEAQGKYSFITSYACSIIDASQNFEHLDRFAIHLKGVDWSLIKIILEKKYEKFSFAVRSLYGANDVLQVQTDRRIIKTIKMPENKIENLELLLKPLVESGHYKSDAEEHRKWLLSQHDGENLSKVHETWLKTPTLALDLLKTQLILNYIRGIEKDSMRAVIELIAALTGREKFPLKFFKFLKKLGTPYFETVMRMCGFDPSIKEKKPLFKKKEKINAFDSHIKYALMPVKGFAYRFPSLEQEQLTYFSFRHGYESRRYFEAEFSAEEFTVNGKKLEYKWESGLKTEGNLRAIFTRFLQLVGDAWQGLEIEKSVEEFMVLAKDIGLEAQEKIKDELQRKIAANPVTRLWHGLTFAQLGLVDRTLRSLFPAVSYDAEKKREFLFVKRPNLLASFDFKIKSSEEFTGRITLPYQVINSSKEPVAFLSVDVEVHTKPQGSYERTPSRRNMIGANPCVTTSEVFMHSFEWQGKAAKDAHLRKVIADKLLAEILVPLKGDPFEKDSSEDKASASSEDFKKEVDSESRGSEDTGKEEEGNGKGQGIFLVRYP